jgi:hypothetical protein
MNNIRFVCSGLRFSLKNFTFQILQLGKPDFVTVKITGLELTDDHFGNKYQA